MERFRIRRATGWRALSRAIGAAVGSVREHGYCWASWQPQVVALAAPVAVPSHPVYVLNMSVTGDIAPAEVVERLRDPLLDLARRLRDSIGNL
jgi:DNA-binding IclR family transcriptional regulator